MPGVASHGRGVPVTVVTGLPLWVAGAVLGSALLHATWNALAKAIPHRLLAGALIGCSYAVVGAAWCVLAPVPDAASWPYLVTSAILQTGYLLLLTAAYSHGEFRRVYPVARGTAPLLVTAFSLLVLGERLHAAQLAGIALVAGALGWLALVPDARARVGAGSGRAGSNGAGHGPGGVPSGDEATGRGTDPRAGRRRPAGLGLAAATGVVIAAYSLVDGIGVRHSGTAAGYAAWSLVVHGPLLVTTCVALAGPRRLAGWLRHTDSGAGTVRADRATRRARPQVMIATGLVGGVLSLAAYAIVLWAQSRASLSLVSATRETSVLFAGLIGAVFFAEGFSARQTVAAFAVVAGVVLMQWQ